MNRFTKKTILCALATAVTCFFAGCAVPAYDIEVYLSPKLKEKYQIYPSLEMDFIGVTQTEAEHFESVKINEYFMRNNPLRDGYTHITVKFAENNAIAKTIKSSDPVWERFHRNSADTLLVMVNMPDANLFKDKNNPYRLELPLTHPWYKIGHDTLYFELTPGGI